VPADRDLTTHLTPFENEGLGAFNPNALGFTNSILEGAFQATFKWQPGQNKGGTMYVKLAAC
jgi:hypothetical protein